MEYSRENLCSIFLCTHKFMYDEAANAGYSTNTNFFIGNLTEDPLRVSWRGNKNMSWDQISNLMYANNVNPIYGHYDVNTRERYKVDTSNFSSIYLLPDKCTVIKNISKVIWFKTKEDESISLLISDASLQPSYRKNMEAVKGDVMTTKSGKNYYRIRTTILKG